MPGIENNRLHLQHGLQAPGRGNLEQQPDLSLIRRTKTLGQDI
jgi:hypothetical protein